MGSITTHLPELSKKDSLLTEAELVDPNLQFLNEDQMFSAFAPSWRLVKREVARNRIQRKNETTYMQVCALPIFQTLNNNLKSAIADFMRLHP